MPSLSLKEAWRRLSGSRFDAGSPNANARTVSPEEFQNELVTLGLSGKPFTPATYAAALEAYMGLTIRFRSLSDQDWPQFSRRLARSGTMAELIYCSDPPGVTILLPNSLPPLLFNLAAYHELAHLAAGHHFPDAAEDLQWQQARYLSIRVPPSDPCRREEEANLRARYALLAGSLGPRNPYYRDMYDIL